AGVQGPGGCGTQPDLLHRRRPAALRQPASRRGRWRAFGTGQGIAADQGQAVVQREFLTDPQGSMERAKPGNRSSSTKRNRQMKQDEYQLEEMGPCLN